MINATETTINPATPVKVIDSKTKEVVYTTTYANVKRARAKRDKMDQAYGACRYTVVFEWM